MDIVSGQQLKLRYSQLAWKRASAEKELVTEEARLLEVQARLLQAPKLLSHLEAIQASAHTKAVGAYEVILTQIVHEVLGDRWSVKLTTGYRNNQPSLDIDVIRTDEDAVEDILDGNGGALTNVVCAGLRFAVIARAGGRRFIVLDEPDCWMEPARVPAFFRALAQVCEKAKFQAIVVSHHKMDPQDPESLPGADLMPDSVSYVRLREGTAHKIHADCQLAGAVTDGVVSLRAQNLRTHLDTTIRLGPALTFLTGTNNLGKSALIAGLRSLARGGASDSHIRHKTDGLQFDVELLKAGQPHFLSLSRMRKGSPRVILRHWLKGQESPLHEERGAQHSAPEWLSDLLDIREIEGLDPHLMGQKTPVFLLDQPASVRAKLLYAGREAALLARMFKMHRQDTMDAEKAETRSLTLITALRNQLTALSRVSSMEPMVNALVVSEKTIETAAQRRLSLEGFIPKLARITTTTSIPAPTLAVTPPVLHDTLGLQRLAKQIAKLDGQARSVKLPALPAAPVLHDNLALRRVGAQLGKLAAVERLPALPTLPVAPVLSKSHELDELIKRLARQEAQVTAIQNQLAGVTAELTLQHAELDALVEFIGGVCPVCHQHMTKENIL